MTTTIEREAIHERRRKAMRDVVDVCIFLDGVNGAGVEIHTDHALFESPGWDPVELLVEYSLHRAAYLAANTPDADVRYQLLNIVVHAGSECRLEMLVDNLKLDDLDPKGVWALLQEIAKMLLKAEEDGVKIPDAFKAWEQERAAPAV